MKKLLLGFWVSSILLVGLQTVSYGEEDVQSLLKKLEKEQEQRERITVFVDGKVIKAANTKVISGRTMLPMKTILSNIGVINDSKHMNWNPKSKSIKIVKDSKTVELKINSSSAKINNQDILLDVKPTVIDGMTYIPVKFISQCFDKDVYWDSENRALLINDIDKIGKVKQIVKKANDRSINLKTLKFKQTVHGDIDMVLFDEKRKEISDATLCAQIDRTSLSAEFKGTTKNSKGENASNEMYIINGKEYDKKILNGKATDWSLSNQKHTSKSFEELSGIKLTSDKNLPYEMSLQDIDDTQFKLTSNDYYAYLYYRRGMMISSHYELPDKIYKSISTSMLISIQDYSLNRMEIFINMSEEKPKKESKSILGETYGTTKMNTLVDFSDYDMPLDYKLPSDLKEKIDSGYFN